jgi:ABC-type sugar transport system substrate-binding protein
MIHSMRTGRTPGHAKNRVRAAAALTGLALVALSACSSSGSATSGDASSSSAADAAPSGALNGHGAKIVYFGPSPTGNAYLTLQQSSLKAQAAAQGYDVSFVLNNIDASQEGQQIQQYVASGQKPAAFILFPLDTQAGIQQAAELSRVAPVFQINFAVAPGGFKYVTAFVGANDYSIGQNAGSNLLKLRSQLQTQDTTLHSAGGNLLLITGPQGTSVQVLRDAGLKAAIAGQGVNILNVTYANTDPTSAYTAALPVLAKYKSKVDFIYAVNDDAASGIVKAAIQDGLTPGKNVWIVSGNCGGSKSVLLNHQVYATSLQLPTIEGAAMLQTIVRYLATKKVIVGTQTLPATAAVPAQTLTPPYQTNYLPNPSVVAPDAAALNAKVWGQTLTQACPLT